MKSLKLYHGTNHINNPFQYAYAGLGNCQEGPGFYLTNTENVAKGYGKYILVVEAKYRKIVPQVGKPNTNQLTSLIKKAPDLKITLEDYDEDPRVALNQAIKIYTTYYKNPSDAFQNVWAGFYRDHPGQYLRNMVDMGYDGAIAKFNNGIIHFIAFDPRKLKVISRIETR